MTLTIYSACSAATKRSAAGPAGPCVPRPKIVENAEGSVGTRRPVSRVLSDARKRETAIPLDRPLLAGSRDLPGPLGPATALPARAGARSLFGLAPGGACHAVPVAGNAVGSYPTLSPLPAPRGRRSAFCGAFPGVTPGGRYPPPCRRGARTFLEGSRSPAAVRPSGPGGMWAERSFDSSIPKIRHPQVAKRSGGPKRNRPKMRARFSLTAALHRRVGLGPPDRPFRPTVG